MLCKQSAFFFLALLLSVDLSCAEAEDDWGNDWEQPSAVDSSFEVSYGYAHLFKSNSVNKQQAILNEFRLQNKLEYRHDDFIINSDMQLLIDPLVDDYRIDVRELNASFQWLSSSDIKLGRQIVTWGTGDLVFLNDLFPKNWRSFFNGRQDSELKLPSDALRFSHYAELFNFDFVYTPQFEPDQVLTGERYSFFVPELGVIQPDPQLEINSPNGSEIALRVFRNLNGHEWAVYLNRGYFKSPSKMFIDGSLSHSKISTLGISYRSSFAGGIVNFESVYYQSAEDKTGTDPLIDNSQFRVLLGYEKELAANYTLATQYYVEQIEHYDALVNNALTIDRLPAETRTLTTLRFTQLAMQQRLINSLMIFYSPSDKDYFLRYSSQFKVSDNWRLNAGINWLDGKQPFTFFSQLQDNSNVFLRMHYYFK